MTDETWMPILTKTISLEKIEAIAREMRRTSKATTLIDFLTPEEIEIEARAIINRVYQERLERLKRECQESC
jgi:hypothetical protein